MFGPLFVVNVLKRGIERIPARGRVVSKFRFVFFELHEVDNFCLSRKAHRESTPIPHMAAQGHFDK